MTYEDALIWCEEFISNLPKDRRYYWTHNAMIVCMEALEKQMPKKPVCAATKTYKNIFDGSEVEVHELESCPVCGFYPLETRYVRLHSCPKCNQRIDWGEEE